MSTNKPANILKNYYIFVIAICLSLLSSCNGASKEEAEAQRLFEHGDYLQAAQIYEAMGHRYEDYYKCILFHAKELFGSKDYDQAIVYFEIVRQSEKNLKGSEWVDRRSYVNALEALINGDDEKALELLTPLVRNSGSLFDSAKLCAEIRYRIQTPQREAEERKREAEESEAVSREEDYERLMAYLASAGLSEYSGQINKQKKFDENVISLVNALGTRLLDQELADLVGNNRCYAVLSAIILRNLPESSQFRQIPNDYLSDVERISTIGAWYDTLSIENTLRMASALPEWKFPGEFSYIEEALTEMVQTSRDTYDKMLFYAALIFLADDDFDLHKYYPDIDQNSFPFNTRIEIKQILMQGLTKRNLLQHGPSRIYTPDEYNTLVNGDITPAPIDGGYIRVIDFSGIPSNAKRDSYISYPKSTYLFVATNPAHARFIVFETYLADKSSQYNIVGSTSNRTVRVYTPSVRVKIVDMLTGKIILEETQTAVLSPEYSVPSDVYDEFYPTRELQSDKYIAAMISVAPINVD